VNQSVKELFFMQEHKSPKPEDKSQQ